MNINYFWQRKQDKKNDTWKGSHTVEEIIKRERKELRKKLTVPIGGKKKTHDMDDEMYETIDKMLQSRTEADVEIAREIVFDCNMSYKYMDKLVTEHRNILLYGYTEMNITGGFHTFSSGSYGYNGTV